MYRVKSSVVIIYFSCLSSPIGCAISPIPSIFKIFMTVNTITYSGDASSDTTAAFIIAFTIAAFIIAAFIIACFNKSWWF